MALKHYDSSLFELFERVFATKKEVTLPFNSLREASAFALRMQRLRREIVKERHYLMTAAENTQVSVNKQTFAVSIRPPDLPYLEKVQKALSTLPEVSLEAVKHELENSPLYRPPGGEMESQTAKSSSSQTPFGDTKDGGTGLSPQEETLAKFLGKDKK